jgi:predicted amidohydrolase
MVQLASSKKRDQTIRISMLHFSPSYIDVAKNIDKLEKLVSRALEIHPDIIITPELAVSGYEFQEEIGIEWIKEIVPQTIQRFSQFARTYKVAMILGTPIYKEAQKKLYNAAVFIDEQGQISGEHYKINVVPGGSEQWSSPGQEVKPVCWGKHKVGMLICADAYTDTISAEFDKHDTDVVLNIAAWAPGEYGPNGEWEERSKETGLSFIVCNRTGKEKSMDFSGGATVFVSDGQRLLEYSEEQSAILTIDVDPKTWRPIQDQFTIDEIY